MPSLLSGRSSSLVLAADSLALRNRLALSRRLVDDAWQFNNGLVTQGEASGASVRKDVEVQLLSGAPARCRHLLLRRCERLAPNAPMECVPTPRWRQTCGIGRCR